MLGSVEFVVLLGAVESEVCEGGKLALLGLVFLVFVGCEDGEGVHFGSLKGRVG